MQRRHPFAIVFLLLASCEFEKSSFVISAPKTEPSSGPVSGASAEKAEAPEGPTFFTLEADGNYIPYNEEAARLPSSLVDATSDQLTPFWSETQSATASDFNRDGRMDFFSTQFNFEARLFLAQEDGSFKQSTETLFPLEAGKWSSAMSSMVADLDEDGVRDLLVGLVAEPNLPADAPVVAKQPRLYLSSGAEFSIPADETKAKQGWTFVSEDSLKTLFGRKLDGSEADGNDSVIGAGLTRAAVLAPADFDGDGFPEIFVQLKDAHARVLWSPSLTGTLTAQADGRVLFTPTAAELANSSTQHTAMHWARLDPRMFKLQSTLTVWEKSTAQTSTAPRYTKATGVTTTVVDFKLATNGSTKLGIILDRLQIPDSLIGNGKIVRVRQKGAWVARKFAGISHSRAPLPVVKVTDLNGDGREEVIVADRSAHSTSAAAKCGVGTIPPTEACRQGRLHVYGLNSQTLTFTDWMRNGNFSSATDLGVNDTERDLFQKDFPTSGAVATLDLNSDGVRDLILFPSARSNDERVALLMDLQGIENVAPPAQNPHPDDSVLFETYQRGKGEVIASDSFFSNDTRGLPNGRIKILLSHFDSSARTFKFSRVGTIQEISAYLPEILKVQMDTNSAQQIRDGQIERLVLGVGYSIPENRQTFLSFRIDTPDAQGRVISDPASCPTIRGGEAPQFSVFPPPIVADFNSDQIPDLLNLPVGQGALYYGDGQGCYQHLNRLPMDFRFINQLVSVDLDKDGDLDLVGSVETDTVNDLIHPNARTVLYFNDGTGRFTDVSGMIEVKGKKFMASRVAAADFNSDGTVDLLLFGTNRLRNHPQLASDGVALLLNKGLRQTEDGKTKLEFEDASNCLPDYLRDWGLQSGGAAPDYLPLVGDFDTDQRKDVLLLKRKGNPDLLFNSLTRYSTQEVCAGKVFDREKARIGAYPRFVSAIQDLGAQTPESGPLLSMSPNSTGSAQRIGAGSVGDYNGDGRPDLLLSSPQGAVPNTSVSAFNAVFVNRIHPQFLNDFPSGDWRTWFTLESSALPPELTAKEGAVCNLSQDFDQDMKTDLFLAGPGECSSGSTTPLCKERSATLTPPWNEDVWSFKSWATVLINQTSSSESPVTFSSAALEATNLLIKQELDAFPGTQTFSCTSADFNGDGCPDVFMTGYGFGNRDSDAFGGSSESRYVQSWYAQAKMGRIYLNECSHFAGRIEFRIVEPERNPFKAYATAVGDFDGDRRDEVIQAGANQMHYFEMR